MDRIWSVSYTHLDVYKRQDLYNHLGEKEKDIYARFFAYGLTGVIVDWTMAGMKEDEEELSKTLQSMVINTERIGYELSLIHISGQTRLDVLDGSVECVRDIVSNLNKIEIKGIIITITNPADIIADFVRKATGLPKNRVFSTGTSLDLSLIHI